MLDEKPTFTRREFLYTGLAMASTIPSVPGFLSTSGQAMADTSMRLSSKPGVPQGNVLVVVQLSGGNDGLNTVVPYGMDAYYKARPRIGVNAKTVLSMDDRLGIGLHPDLKEIYQMTEQGICGVVQGVGYPNPIRSHFASMDVWHTGIADGKGTHGWIGKAMDAKAQKTGLDVIDIGSKAPLATQGKDFKPITFEQARTFQWSANHINKNLKQAYDQLHCTGHQSAVVRAGGVGEDPSSFILRTACEAQIASAKVRKAVARHSKTKFPHGRLSSQLQKVASMITAQLPTRIYYVAMGGFDTHAGETGRHSRLMGQFSKAIQAFYAELKATGHDQRVVTLAFSEFGRRVHENASGGTDHGTAAPMFVFGKPVQSGLLGTHSSLTDLDHNRDLKFTLDFRSLYADILDNWLKLNSQAALGKSFAHAHIVRRT